MARDPFAPVTQPSIPPWVWIIAGTFAVLLIGMGATAYLVVSHRNAVQPVMAAPAPATRDARPQPAAAATATASVGTAGAPDKAADKVDKDDKDDRGESHHRAGHHKTKGGGGPAVKSSPGPAAPATPARKKSDMSQKEIDNLLGL